MIREILIWPDPILKKKAKPVGQVDASVRALVQDLFDTMYAADGVGLAAPQIGVLVNVIVMDTRRRQDGVHPVAMIDPVIVTREGTTTYTEGCLSIPGEAEEVERAARITVRFTGVEGRPEALDCDGLLAIAIQHETDHLLGTVYPDHLSVLKRSAMRKRMRRLKAARAAVSDAGLAG